MCVKVFGAGNVLAAHALTACTGYFQNREKGDARTTCRARERTMAQESATPSSLDEGVRCKDLDLRPRGWAPFARTNADDHPLLRHPHRHLPLNLRPPKLRRHVRLSPGVD